MQETSKHADASALRGKVQGLVDRDEAKVLKTQVVYCRNGQKTEFTLHEKGARVRVETTIQLDPFSDHNSQSNHPRKFIFDHPFFVFLWRDKADWPYLGLWVGDDSALQRVNAEP